MAVRHVAPTATSQLSCNQLKKTPDCDVSSQCNSCNSDEDFRCIRSHKYFDFISFLEANLVKSEMQNYVKQKHNQVAHQKIRKKAPNWSLSAAPSPLIRFRPAARLLTFQSGAGSLSVWRQNEIFV